MPGCCVPGCQNKDKTRMPFHTLPRNEQLRNLWLEKIRNPELFDKNETALHHRQVCSVHFEDIQYRTAERQKLNRGAYPVLFLPVIQEIDVREFAKEAVPSLFCHDAIVNYTKSAKSVETNDNVPESKSDKIVEELEVTPDPILFVSSSLDYREEQEVVLTTSNKQPDSVSDPLRKRIVLNPRYTGDCKVEDLESPIKRERNWNLAMNEICALRKKVNNLQNQNRRLVRRVKSMKTLLRHFKKTHSR